MLKIVTADSWSFNEPAMQLVKFSSRGLRGSDLDSLVKRAGHAFANQLMDYRPQPGEIPVHMLAMGSTEAYGPNRNGDGFKEATCRRFHDTFVKSAKVYRHHKNTDPKISYGTVKCSTYNESMRRVELLLLLNATKEAAERNDGFVADQEIEKLARGEDIPGSMACKVDYDECSSCFNKAATRAHYCDEDSCVGPKGEKRGGCRHNLTKVCEDGHLLHVDNPHPHFFDISSVVRPADRIAFGAKADYLLKAASSEIVGGAGLADEIGLVLPTWLQLGKESRATEIVRRLADEEARLSQGKTAADDTIATAIAERKLRVPEVSWMGSAGSTKFAHALRALSDNHVLMSLEMFARTQFDDRFKAAEVSREAAELLPGIFTRALQSFAKQGSLFASEEFRPASDLPSAEQRGVARRLAEDYRVSKEAVQKGIFRSVFRNTSSPGWRAAPDAEKLASASESAQRLATKYAAYQVAYLAALSPDSREIGLTLTSCVLQNAIM